jgi:hypothetical protein
MGSGSAGFYHLDRFCVLAGAGISDRKVGKAGEGVYDVLHRFCDESLTPWKNLSRIS